MSRRAGLIVLDGLGVGGAHDAVEWGDAGSATMGNVMRANPELRLENLERLGLGGCGDSGLLPVDAPLAAHGSAQPRGQGKDSTTGHWELCGLVLDTALPTFPTGFPAELLAEFTRLTGRGVIGNRPGSGTVILDQLASAHMASGDWIVYTSADSVFQVAAHEEVVPLPELYQACKVARRLLVGELGVSRVIARPFVGQDPEWQRTSHRRDFSLEPPGATLLDRLAESAVEVIGVGKVDDLFAGRAIESTHTATNAAAYGLIDRALDSLRGGLIFANVIEFDQSWGHRNDVLGFAAGLAELDRWIPTVQERLRGEDLIILTADHGNDPTTPSTDHSREQVPILVLGPQVKPVSIGERSTLADIGQTIAEFLGVPPLESGTSFLGEVWNG